MPLEVQSDVHSMEDSTFTLSQVMSTVWLKKLRNMDTVTQHTSLLHAETKASSADAMVYKDPEICRKQMVQMSRDGRKKPNKSTSRSSSFFESRIASRCRFRYICNRTETQDYSNSESSEEGPSSYISHEPNSILQQQDQMNHSTQITNKLWPFHIDDELEALAGKWKQLDKEVVPYDFNHVAGLPSPVNDYKYCFRQLDHHVQSVVTTVKEILELVRDPLVVDGCGCLACSTSCSCALGSSLLGEESALLSSNGESRDEVPNLSKTSPNHYSGLAMENRQILIQDLGESKTPTSRRRKVVKLENGIRMRKEKRIWVRTFVPAAPENGELASKLRPSQKQLSLSKRRLNRSDNDVLDRKAFHMKSAHSAIKSNGAECREEAITKQTRASQRTKATKCNQLSKPQVEAPTKKGKSPTHSDKKCSARNGSTDRTVVCNSHPVVKSSFDPEKDFRESMVELVIQNDIHSSQDLEQLLQCYISLNSDEHYHVIVKAFEQVTSGQI